jgi:hypothetical protein
MKLYRKRFLKTGVSKQISQSSETTDAILWSVVPADKACHVRIQGSSRSIVAYYPENWQKTPNWLKPGNAVKIMHTGGLRGRIEVVGHGLIVPTAVAGGNAPDASTPVDCILTGCQLTPALNDPQMVVLVKVGTFRIGGVVYVLDAIPCDSDVYAASMGGFIGTIAGAFAVPAAPAAQYFRYDAVEVGADGVLHYVEGTPFQTTPVYPTLTSGHLQVGSYIVVNAGTIVINGSNIGGQYSTPVATTLSVSLAPDHLHLSDTESIITVTILDQYGVPISSAAPYVLDAEFLNDDDGTLTGDGEAGATANRTGIFVTTTFTYTKGTTDYVLFQFTLHQNIAIAALASIICYSN